MPVLRCSRGMPARRAELLHEIRASGGDAQVTDRFRIVDFENQINLFAFEEAGAFGSWARPIAPGRIRPMRGTRTECGGYVFASTSPDEGWGFCFTVL